MKAFLLWHQSMLSHLFHYDKNKITKKSGVLHFIWSDLFLSFFICFFFFFPQVKTHYNSQEE